MSPARLFAYFDYQCPHCYLATAAVERARLARNISVAWRPVELYAEAGLELAELVEDPVAWSDQLADLEARARTEGLPFRRPAKTIDTTSARQAAEFARDLGPDVFERVHRALFRAYFGEGTDLGDEDLLLSLCEDAGVDRHALAEALSDGRYVSHLADAEEEARRYGVDRLPTMLIGRYRIVGASPPDIIVGAVDRAGAGERMESG